MASPFYLSQEQSQTYLAAKGRIRLRFALEVMKNDIEGQCIAKEIGKRILREVYK